MKIFKKRSNAKHNEGHENQKGKKRQDTRLPKDIGKKMEILKPFIQKNKDINSRSFTMKQANDAKVVVVYMEGVIDDAILNQHILKPLMMKGSNEGLRKEGPEYWVDDIYNTVLEVGQVSRVDTVSALIQDIFDGKVLILFDGCVEVLCVSIYGGKNRDISEPLLDRTTRGPREGFTESLSLNIALVRRKLRDPNLVAEEKTVGKRTRTNVAILYIEDIADPKIVSEIKSRIDNINIDGVLSSGYINQFLEDNPASLFPQSREVERADLVAADLLEGRVAILVDQSPIAVIYPALFVEMLQAAEDYYEKPQQGTYSRNFRFIAFFISISLPAIYVSLLSFSQELIPFDLVIPLAESRKEVPFPVVVEALLMEGILQLIFEAGLRLPAPLGQTVGVVSGIILGQAAISARLASPAMIIIIAVTGICTFVIPNFSMATATRLLRMLMILSSAAFGLFGFSLGWIIILAHLSDLESASAPYFSPFAPMKSQDLKDGLIRSYIWKFIKRPASIPGQDKKRQGSFKRRK